MLDRLNADLEKEQADIVSLLKTGALPEDAVNFNSGTENIESTRVDVGIDPYAGAVEPLFCLFRL